jgi:predicted Zn-dependent peptidase
LLTTVTAYPNSQTIYRRILPNGIVLLVFERFASPSVTVEGVVRVGALQETAAQSGWPI